MAGFGGAVKLTGESEYKKALQQITQSLREVGSEMKVVSSAYDKNDKSTEALSAKSKVLTKQLSDQQSKLKALTDQYNAMNAQYQKQSNAHEKLVKEYNNEKTVLDNIKKTLGESSKEYQDQKAKVEEMATALRKSASAQEANEKSLSNMRVQMNNAQAEINKTTKEIDNLGKETEETSREVEGAGDGFTVFKGVLANLATQGIDMAVNAMKKLGSMAVSVGKQALSSYADYEQLVGGVETLFKESAPQVMKYAQQAYKTAGLSANEYMDTVTSFSASLLQSLGNDTAKAVEYSNRAIIDMSDNANKMGTNISSIQYAYQGFAKQNYTMLDNLKLGYGGTKTEMERLIKDASKMTDIQKELNITVDEGSMSFGNIVNAISVVQKKMDIAGTTSKEASTTISGSISSLKSAWSNLLTGIADDNADIGKLMDELGEQIVTVAKNLAPRISKIIDGIGKFVNTFVTKTLPQIISKLPPELQKKIEGIRNAFKWFADNRKLIVSAITAMISAFAVAKIASFATNIVLVVKNMISATSAIDGVTKSMQLLGGAISANPIGLLAGAIGAVVGGLVAWNAQSQSTTDSIFEEADAVDNARASYEQLHQQKQDAINQGLTEMSYYESLWNELQQIVDANGKVKEGYESRASYITSQLSDALGTEIKLNEGVVEGYNEIKDSINKVIEAKKAQIILDAQEDTYKTAITERANAVKKLGELEKQMYDEAKYYKEMTVNLATARTDAERRAWLNRVSDAERSYKLAKETYDNQLGLVEQYNYDIAQYENNMALMHEEKYNEINNVTWESVKTYQSAGDAKKAELEDQIATEKASLEILRKQAIDNNTDMYNDQITASENRLSQLNADLQQYNSALTAGNETTKNTWIQALDDQISAITSKDYEFRDAGNGEIQTYVDGVKTSSPYALSTMKSFVNDIVQQVRDGKLDANEAGKMIIASINTGITDINGLRTLEKSATGASRDMLNSLKNVDGRSVTEQAWAISNNLLAGLSGGINRGDSRSGVFSSISALGRSMLAQLKASLQEHSPSKATREMGQFLLEGLGLGVEDKEDEVIGKMNDLGTSMIASLNDGLSDTIDTRSIDGISVKSASGSASTYADNTVSQFKQALSEMKIELDSEKVGTFVDRTVTKLVYN